MLVDVMISNKIPWENVRPANKEAFGIMAALGKDEWLDATDAMILSQVLSDPDSKFFFTTDSAMLRNAVIMDAEKSLRGEGKRRAILKISDTF